MCMFRAWCLVEGARFAAPPCERMWDACRPADSKGPDDASGIVDSQLRETDKDMSLSELVKRCCRGQVKVTGQEATRVLWSPQSPSKWHCSCRIGSVPKPKRRVTLRFASVPAVWHQPHWRTWPIAHRPLLASSSLCIA